MFETWLAPVKAQIPADLSKEDYGALTQALIQEAHRRLADFMGGVRLYQDSTLEKEKGPDPALLWQAGTTRLLDYAPDSAGPVLFVVPSLINRFDILDLSQDFSFLRFMAMLGFHPIVLDWQEPGPQEQKFSLEDYITQRLEPALDITLTKTGQKQAHIIGYCMGGVLALALAFLNQDKTKSLSLMATPWDFATGAVGGVPPAHTSAGQFFLEKANWALPFFKETGVLPTQWLHAVLAGFQPLSMVEKFARLMTGGVDEAQKEKFVLTEDWLNDGVPLAWPVAQECLEKWYGKNEMATGQWRLKGQLITPASYTKPVSLFVPQRDKVVPPASALALSGTFLQAEIFTPDTGHLGLMVGREALAQVWVPFARWLYAAS